MKMIEISRKGQFVGNNWYEFIVKEQWLDGWGVRTQKGRTRPKFYEIKENGKTMLITSLHQTFNARKKQILSK